MLTRYGNSPSSPEQAGESSVGNSSAGAQSAPLNTNRTPAPSSVLGKTTVALNRSRFGTMFGPLTADLGEAVLTLFLEDFPALTSPVLEKEQELKDQNQVSGRKWPESLAKYDPASHGLKTRQCLLFEDSTESFATLPRWGMMRRGELWELATPDFGTAESASGLWATPTCRDWKDTPGMSKTREAGKHRVDQLPRQVYASLDGSGLFSPVTVMRKDSVLSAEMIMQIAGAQDQQWTNANTSSETESCGQDQGYGTLNPPWVEWLMGWPIGWTALNESETANAHRQWLSLGKSCQQ